MHPSRFLFVCTGNVCRSFMAELLLKEMAASRGLKLEVRSCGVAAERYFQVPPEIWRALEPLGISPCPHVPQLVSRELLGWADVALAMTRAHCEYVCDLYPEFTAKIEPLRRFAGFPDDEDVEDPIGRPDAVYAACRDRIKEALEALLKKYTPAQSQP